MSRPLLQVIIASTRPGRIGPAVAHWVVDAAQRQGSFDVELVDLAEVDLPLYDEPSHPVLGQYVHDHAKAWSKIVQRADAFVFVMPEYNHGYNAALKNALDYLHVEWNDKAVGLVSYGGISGGLRATAVLRPTLVALRMVPIADHVPLPLVTQHMEDGRFIPTDIHEAGATAMVAQLARMTEILRTLREESHQ